MNKNDLIKSMARETKLTKKEAGEALRALTTIISKALKNGEKVQLVGFGKFEVKNRVARESINPRSKEKIFIPASKVPSFKAHKSFKQSVI